MTPITGSGLLKGGKKTAGTKTKVLKRKSSDLTLQEVSTYETNRDWVFSHLRSPQSFLLCRLRTR